ncbi:MAG TPA: hypothetical protein VMT86_08500 [Bryobacteraceae bacterium]|nr:hypothetical protein [Bryobacteraceae bacterium]
MLPRDLKASQFAAYPPEARKLAVEHIALLQELPLSFLPLLLREIIEYDWKFPPERREVENQFAYLEGHPAVARRQLLAGFEKLRLAPALEAFDWVNEPVQFSEQLSSHLWATLQIDAFRQAAIDYVHTVNSAVPETALPMPRLGIAVIGQGVAENRYHLFRKLRPHGTYFSQVKPEDGLHMLLDAVSARAEAHPAAYGHWYIDGGSEEPVRNQGVVHFSYDSLAPARGALQEKMQKIYQSGIGPEAFRTMLAGMRPAELGLGNLADGVLRRFQVSVLTEGSGTQVFATTFVQWAAREAYRRAQPVTMLLRFAPRQRARPMNELLNETEHKPELDPRGSLIDADMGAYYSWVNQQRLAGADQASFLVWFEGHNEACAVGPGWARGTESSSAVDLGQIIKQIA